MSRFGWGKKQTSARKTPRSVRLQLEALEDRLVPATTSYTVAAGDVATLIADINAANANGANTPTTINLTAGTYDFTAADNNTYGPNALPAITGDVTINGNGAVLTRDASLGQNTPFRLFYVAGSSPTGSSSTTQPAGSLTLENLTLEGGLAQGGGSGTGGGGLGAGGAIFNQGNLTLNGVTVTQNIAEGGSAGSGTAGGGGGMGQAAQGDNGGGFGISGGASSGGTGSSSGSGGAGGIGGGGGDSTIASTSTTSYSGGTGGFGGGGGSGVSQGGAGGFGGGGGAASSSSGTVGAGGFGAGAGGASAGGGGLGAGGAIFNQYGTTTLINSTLAGNLAEGGQGGANAGDGYGGAVFNLNGTLTVVSSTLADNSTQGATNGGGAVYNLAMGTTTASGSTTSTGVPSTVNLTDSILADSIGSNDLVNDQNNSTAGSAVVNATTPNIVMGLSTIDGATTNGTPSTANPQLGLLFNYGGPTATMPLLAGSAALGTGVSGANVPATDQRGVARGNVLDLGAYQGTPPEAATTSLALTISNTNVSAGQSVTLTATITPSVSTTTPAGTVQFVDTTTGTTLGSGAVVNGQATLSTTALTAGSHTITATYQSSNSIGGSSGSASLVVGSSNQLWLGQVYHDLLGRAIDPSGLAYWSSILAGSSRTQVAYLIEQTTEYRTDEIQAAFEKLLGRAADANSLSYFLGLMGQGTNIQTIEGLIAGSTEYYQNRGGGTNVGFLTAVYQDFLNRPLDATGQQVWQAALASGQTTTQVVLGILGTQEYMSDLVQTDYQTYLHRAADPTSLSAFVTSLMQGSDNDLVVASLLGSGEYMTANATA